MKLAMFVLVALASSSAVQAVDIRADLSILGGTTAGNWNNISNLQGITNLIDFSSGAATGVGLNGSASAWLPGQGDTSAAFASADWMLTSAAADGAQLAASTSGVFTLANLPAGNYKIEVVSARTADGYLNTFHVNGALADHTFLGTAVATPWNSTTDGLSHSNWLVWSNVAVANGMVSIQLDAGPGTPGILNALRVSTVPAPGAAMMLAAGLALIARRRRA